MFIICSNITSFVTDELHCPPGITFFQMEKHKPESARQLRERLEAVEKENFILKSHLKTTKKNELTTKIVRKLLQFNVFDEQIKLNKLRDQYERKSEMINDLVKRVVNEVVDLKETFLSVEEVEEMVEEVLEKRSKDELCKVIYVTP